MANNLASEFSEATQATTESSDVIYEDSSTTNMTGETSIPETAATETLEEECGYDFAAEKSRNELLISDLQ